jgi:hypothetical protein
MGCTGMLLPSSNLVLLLLFLAQIFRDKGKKRRGFKGCKPGLKQDFKNLIYLLKIIFKGYKYLV